MSRLGGSPPPCSRCGEPDSLGHRCQADLARSYCISWNCTDDDCQDMTHLRLFRGDRRPAVRRDGELADRRDPIEGG